MSTQRSRSTRSTAIVAGGLLCAAVLGSATRHSVSAGTTVPGGDSTAPDDGGVPSWCGPDEIRLGFTDGFGGNSWRLVTTAAARDEASKCPSVVDVQYADGQGDTQKAISDIQSMVASGVDAIVAPRRREAILLPCAAPTSRASPSRTGLPPAARRARTCDIFIGSDFDEAGVLWGTGSSRTFPTAATC